MNTKENIAKYALLAFYFSIPFSSALYRISILALLCILLTDTLEMICKTIKEKDITINIYKKPIIYLPITLMGWMIISKFWTTAPQSLYAYETLRYGKLLMIPVLAYLQVRYYKDSHKQLIISFLCGVIILITPTYLDFLGIFNWLGYDGKNFANQSYARMTDQGRNLVYLRNQIIHGYMISIFCAILFIFSFYNRKRIFLYSLGIALSIFNILFLIKGRMALISLIGGHIVLLLHSNVNKKIKAFATIGVIIFAIILTISNSTIQMRLHSIYAEAINYIEYTDITTSGGIRLHYWTISWNLFIQHPLIGAGGGSFREFLIKSNDPLLPQNHYHTHNEYLTLLSLYGIFGLGIFLWFIREIYIGLRHMESPEIRYSIFAAITIFLINALTDSSLNNQWEGWTFVMFTSLVAANLVLKDSKYECI